MKILIYGLTMVGSRWYKRNCTGDATRIISLTVYKDANGQPAQCNFAFFDKDENYKDNIEYDVTSWDDVIDHFVDEIE